MGPDGNTVDSQSETVFTTDMTKTQQHTEPCGCVHEGIDVPDDQMIGQGWRWVKACPEHYATRTTQMVGHLDKRYYPS